MKKTLTVLLSIFLLINSVNAEELDNNMPASSNDKSNIINEEVLKNTTSEKQDEISNETLDNKDAIQPEEKKQSDIKPLDTLVKCTQVGYYGNCEKFELTFAFEIPEDYDKETIVFSPKVYQDLREVLSYNGIQPGDKFTINFKIINKSKYTYTYDESSFEIFPDDEKGYEKISDDEKKFNGAGVTELNNYYRRFNSALYALGLDERKNITDEILDKALKNANYNGINDYTKYLLDFYNQKYGTNHKELKEFSYGVIKEIFGAYDPFYTNNEAYYKWTYVDGDKNNGPTYLGTSMTMGSSYAKQEVIEEINKKVKEENCVKEDGSADINSFLLDFYNRKYGLNVKSLDELTGEVAYKLFGESTKSYNIRNIVENNATLLALYFDYFYNKCISWTFENDKITDQNSQDFSFGEYMRNKTKGDKEIKESIGTLKPEETKELNNMSVNYNGHYINNVGQLTSYDWHVQFSYSILKGNLIVKYIDDEGNELSKPEKYTEIVGTKYKTSEKEFEYYKLIDIKGNEEGEYVDGTTEVTYIYSFVGGTGGDIVDPAFPKTGVEDSNLPEVIFSLSSLLLAGTILLKKKFN